MVSLAELYKHYQDIFRPQQPTSWVTIIQHDPCVYCGQVVRGDRWSREHIVPKSKGGLNNSDNIVNACKRCNTMRHNVPFLLFILDPPERIRTYWQSVGGIFPRSDHADQ